MKSKEAIERHIKELLSEMTVEEKLDELDPNIMGIEWEKIEEPMRRECLEKLEKRRADARVYNALQKYAKEQTRLGIPFLFHEEALHGLHRRDATIFPQQLTLAGAFEPALCEDMGRMVAAETRAKNIHEVLAPVLDLARDPRWGADGGNLRRRYLSFLEAWCRGCAGIAGRGSCNRPYSSVRTEALYRLRKSDRRIKLCTDYNGTA